MNGKLFNLDGKCNMKDKLTFVVLATLLSLLPIALNAKKHDKKLSILKVQYFNKMFGHVHENPSVYSDSLTTIGCNHPVKVLKSTSKKNGKSQIFHNKNWYMVKVGPYNGFVRKNHLAGRRVKCFNEKYSKFFDLFKVDLTEMYYWGRLYDQFVIGKSRVD
jgi:hypothetical protein